MSTPTITVVPALGAMRRRVILSTYWMATLADGASRIIIPLYLTRIGVPASSIGLTFLFFELFSLFSSVGSGFLLNRVGYKPALVSSLGIHTAASFGYMLIVPDLALWILMLIVAILRAANGVAKELIKTASTAYFKVFVDQKPRRDRRAVQLLLGGKDGMKGFGMLVGGVLLALLDFRLAFGVLGVSTLGCLVLAVRLLNDHVENDRVALRGLLNVKPRLALLSLSRAFLYAGRDLWLVVPVPLYLNSQGYSDVSIAAIFALSLVLFGATQPVAIGWFRHTWQIEAAAIAGPLLCLAIPAGLLYASLESVPVIVALFGFNLVAGVATMPHNHLHLKYAQADRAAVDIAFYKTGAQFGKLLSVPVSGVLYGRYGLGPCLIASAVSLLLSSAAAALMAMARPTWRSPTVIDVRDRGSVTGSSAPHHRRLRLHDGANADA